VRHDEIVESVREALLCMQRNSWEQGVCAQAFLELKDDRMVVLCAHEALVRQQEDGRLGVMGGDTSVVDAAANGEAVLAAACLTGESRYADAAGKMLEWLLEKENRNPEGIIYHRTDARQVWVDSMYMAPPFLAAAGRYADSIAQIEGYRRILWNPDAGLFSHIWDDGRKAFERKSYWGVGNGWAITGMIRVTSFLPAGFTAQKERMIGWACETVIACLKYLRDDGLFHDVLDDDTTFVETNAAQMFAYAIFRLVAMKEMDRSFLDFAWSMREAVLKKVDRWGFVQGVCGSPRFDSAGTAAEGQAFFLMMEAAARQCM